jgi:hypothetical protein
LNSLTAFSISSSLLRETFKHLADEMSEVIPICMYIA